MRTRRWQHLVRVCERWRQIIYASPKYLDLYFYCSNRYRFKKTLRRWPAFPLILDYCIACDDMDGEQDDLIAALGHRERVQHIDITMTSEDSMDGVGSALAKHFPLLTYLCLFADPRDERDRPCFLLSLLGGSAPCLQHLRIQGIIFPDLPSFLPSAPNLLSLDINNIPPYSYVSPQEMVRGLTTLTKLRALGITYSADELRGYGKTEGRPDPIHAVLPALTELEFEGDSEYLEDFVSRIDAPRLDELSVRIEHYEQGVRTRLSQFIDRTNLKLAQFRHAQVILDHDYTFVELDLPQGECHRACLFLGISYEKDKGILFLVSSIANVLNQLVPMLSDADYLSIKNMICLNEEERDALESTDWLPLFRSLSAVEAIEVSGGLAGYITSALDDAPEEMADTLFPVLKSLWFDDEEQTDRGKPVGSTERFLSLRRHSGRPVTIVNSRDEFAERLNAHQLEALGKRVWTRC